MSRKQFKVLAEAIAKLKDSNERKRMADVIGKVCASANGRFDWTRWHSACRCAG